MKLGKIILPALLAIGAVSGFAFAKQAEEKQLAPAAALTYAGDYEIDVGMNVKASSQAGQTWSETVFWLGLQSGDVSQGDYIAVRLKSESTTGSYFDFMPNVNGTIWKVQLAEANVFDSDLGGVKIIPAVAANAGVAQTYAGGRHYDFAMHIAPADDVWICVPKTSFTRNHSENSVTAPEWNSGLWAIYFRFYGTTYDNINFNIGNIYSANIDSDGHLVKKTCLVNWADVADSSTIHPDFNPQLIDLTRNNLNLVPAAKFVQQIENVDACNATQATAAYNNLNETYSGLTNAQKFYLDEYQIYDYADGDTGHTGGRGVAYSASAKWAQICAAAGHASSARILFNKKNDSIVLTVALTSTLVLLSVAGAYFIIRRRKLQK